MCVVQCRMKFLSLVNTIVNPQAVEMRQIQDQTRVCWHGATGYCGPRSPSFRLYECCL